MDKGYIDTKDAQVFVRITTKKTNKTYGFTHVFRRLFHPFKEQELGRNSFHFCLKRLLYFEKVYFQTLLIVFFEILTNMKTGFTSINTTQNT